MIVNAVTFIPDPGEPVRPTAPAAPVAADPSWMDQALTFADQHQQVIAIAAIGIANLIALRLLTKVIRRKKGTPAVSEGRVRKALVYLAASIGSAFTLTSMWNVFEHSFNIDNWGVRLVLCGVFEIMMLSSAVNSRAFRLRRAKQQSELSTPTESPAATPTAERRELDVDGIAVWVFAAVAGVICFTDSTNPVEAGMRGFLPLAVAWMWERAIAADLRTFARTVRDKKINLRISTERILVALRIAEPTGRDVSEVDKARYRSAFTIAAFKLHTLRADKALHWRISIARWRLRRAGLAIMKRSGVAELVAARRDVATLYGIEDFTAPDAVGHLAGWRDRVIDVTPADGDTTNATDAATLTQAPAQSPAVTGTATNAPTVTRPAVTPTVTQSAVSGVIVTNTPATNGRVRPLSRDVIDAEFASWTTQQVEDYAAERARHVLAETDNKTAGMREYFLICLALGVEPKGSAMAKAVGASGGLGRGKAIEWHGALAVDDAESVLRGALARVTAERAAGGDDRD
ncbi:hypothetical protein ACGFIW_01550 [Micromonospora sp. NPDC048935]|uniref:hypothetical protein n=1 Tax=Micromonospora sp. NPDC048935 TaxID=3364262 RepID=UPI003720196C